MSCRHREQPKVGEEGIWPLFVIVQASSLTRSVLLFSQHRSQPAANETQAIVALVAAAPDSPGRR